jgi:hypothetical protein
MSQVCELFCRGLTPSEIPAVIRERTGIPMTREQPYQYLSEAARQGFLCYHAPLELALSH